MENREIDFIARHYRKGCFSPDAAWRRLSIAPSAWWRKYRVAAAVAAMVILTATATMFYREYSIDNVPEEVNQASPLTVVKVIDFDNAPLPEVIEKIESVYNVRVGQLPDSPEKYVLTLRYEGTPTDLIAIINEILGTQMTVEEK